MREHNSEGAGSRANGFQPQIARCLESRAGEPYAETSRVPTKDDGDGPDLGEVLFEHPKGRGMTFRFSIRSYKGRRFLDAREWGERDGKPMATGKGATFPLDGLEALTDALLARRDGSEPGTGNTL